MKLGAIPAFLFLLATAAAPASAAIATLGVSNQNFTLTGIGVDANGDGQSTVSWGTCKFDGTNTSCTLTGPFTGFAGGRHIQFRPDLRRKWRIPIDCGLTIARQQFLYV